MLHKFFLLVLVLLFNVLSGHAAESGRLNSVDQELLPTTTEINAALTELEQDQRPLEEKEKLQQQLKNALTTLAKLEQMTQELEKIQNLMTNSEQKLAALHQDYEQACKQYGKLPDTVSLKGEQLVSELERVKVENELAHSELKQANAAYNRIQTIPERAQSNIFKNDQQIDKLQQNLNQDHHSFTLEDKLKQLQLVYLNQDNEVMNAELAGQIVLLDAADYRQRISKLKADYYQGLLMKLQEQQNADLSAQIGEDSKGTSPDGQKSVALQEEELRLIAQIPELAKELRLNEIIGDALNEQLRFNLRLKEKRQQVEAASSIAEQIQHNLSSQLEGMEKSLLLSRILNRQQTQISQLKLERISMDSIADVNLKLFDIRSYRDQLFDLEDYINTLIKQQPKLEPYRKELSIILSKRKELVNQLNQQFSSTLSTEIGLKLKYDEFDRMCEGIQSKITENLFWLRSNQPLGSAFFKILGPSVRDSVSRLKAKWTDPDKWTASLQTLAIYVLPALLLGLIIKLFWAQRLTDFGNKLARRLDGPADNLRVTPWALLTEILLSLPLMTLWFGFGTVLICLVNVDTSHQQEVMRILVIHILVFVFFLEILKPNAFAQRHLCLNPEDLAANRKLLSRIWYAMIPLLVVGNIVESNTAEIYFNTMGSLIMLLASLYLSVISLIWIKNQLKQTNPLSLMQWITALSCVVSSIGVVVLLSTGYFYTTVKLINRLAYTAYLGAFFWISSQLIRRAVYVLKNQAQTNRWGKQESQPDKSYLYRIDFLNFSNLSERIFRLLRLLLLCLVLFTMYCQWDDLAGALLYLDTIDVWSKTEVVNDTEVVVQRLSLSSLLLSMLILIATTYLSKNVPTLLERLFSLQHGQYKNSTGYTVKIISSYAITTVGIILAAGTLGLSWSNMQWLVAALSVGLGFGLQEIFANFVSGLIILFERQLRVGDIITLGTLSGKVSKIRIRATTILSFENKEVMIPNKQFITQALTNWSLSNTITMLEYNVGIALHADVDRAKALIKQVVQSCPYLDKGAQSVIYINAIDGRGVKIKCEVQVSEIGKRKLTFDYLSHEILKQFEENGIRLRRPDPL